MAAGSKKAAPRRGTAGRPELAWRGQLEGLDEDGVRRCTIALDDAGWYVVVHGVGVNDEGGRYEWSRQELGDDGHPVRHSSMPVAANLADRLIDQFDVEHEEMDALRRVEEAEARRVAEQARDEAEAEAARVAAEAADAEGSEEPTV